MAQPTSAVGCGEAAAEHAWHSPRLQSVAVRLPRNSSLVWAACVEWNAFGVWSLEGLAFRFRRCGYLSKVGHGRAHTVIEP
eukprot:5443733-Prymnesium_polylepis.2